MATGKSAMFGLLLFILIYYCRQAEGCGWTTSSRSGTVSSPNFPNNYPNGQDCVYVIKAPVGNQVTLTFTDFSLETAVNCSYDYVEIRDGDETSRVIGRHCGRSLPGFKRTSGKQLWIKFHTDGSVTSRGFRATFRSVPVCRLDTRALDGTIQSPNFPYNYTNNQNCVYTITAPVGYKVTLNFTDFELESHWNCSYDYLEIRDGNETSPVIGRYCRSLPGPKRASGNQMTIRFHSDGSVIKRGFRATFISVTACGWSVTSLYGAVLSPNFPNNYPNRQNCVYVIRAPVGYHVTLAFSDFDLEPNGNCTFDYLEIRDGGQTSPIIGRHCGGTSLPGPKRTSGNQMWIRFKTDGSITGRGFKASFISVSGCGVATRALSGTIQSPNYPGNYPHKQNCLYTITAPASYHVRLTFTDFNLEAERNCGYDYLEIRDGNQTSPVIGRYCNTSLPAPAVTSGSQMWIRFRSDWSVTRRGFRATFQSECGWHTTALQGTVLSPNYPGFYRNNQICTYIITAPAGYQVTLDFVFFELEAARNCTFDYLEIRDGLQTSSVIGRYCNTSLPGTKRTSGNRMWIRFFSDGSVVRRGFRATFRSVSECRQDTRGLSGTVQSPNYPDNYPNRQSCVYTITAPAGYRITLTFTDLSLESCCDFVEIRDGNRTSPVIGLYRNSLPGPANTSGNQMWIRFFSDGSITRRGFRATYISAPGDPSMAALEQSRVQKTQVTEVNTTKAAASVTESTTPEQTSEPNTTASSSATSPTPGTTSVPATPPSTAVNTTTRDASIPPGFSVVVATTDTQPFDTNGNSEMTLTCDPDEAVDVVSHVWSVACARQKESVCIFKPRPPQDDGENVTCTITSSDGRSASGVLQIELNYPPQEAPFISGYSKDKVYQQGQSLTLTCSVDGGKPPVTSVSFSCGGTHQGNSTENIYGPTYVKKVLSIASLTAEDDGQTCVCGATWKDADLYTLSDSAVLSVEPTPITSTEELKFVSQVVGGVIGGICVITFLFVAICCFVNRSSKKKMTDNEPDGNIFIVMGNSMQRPRQREGRPFIINPIYTEPTPVD
ncbi:tolloid-like protein 2 [Babylonia areolata]|uniref:tolloid-like protein 2 n=1 Tax=Babylonia areolata TaxID=304850 RepID=UPI003FD15A8D